MYVRTFLKQNNHTFHVSFSYIHITHEHTYGTHCLPSMCRQFTFKELWTACSPQSNTRWIRHTFTAQINQVSHYIHTADTTLELTNRIGIQHGRTYVGTNINVNEYSTSIRMYVCMYVLTLCTYCILGSCAYDASRF